MIDGTRLRWVRREHGLSQERLAWAAGVSIATVGNLERQPRSYCANRTLALLCEALGEPPDALTPPVRTVRKPAAADAPAERSSWTCSAAFPARADQVGQARAFLRRMLGDCPAAEDAVLICSELAANAVVHSASARPGGRFVVRAEVREGDYAWVEVQDEGGRWAEGEHPGHGGRGLAIVAALADYWDIRGDDTGRVVCARFDWPVNPPAS
jgi:anti-sigma regulatory factor (Ser/Thr protein kinase)/DNA-binding XRE family transcriptional regulator